MYYAKTVTSAIELTVNAREQADQLYRKSLWDNNVYSLTGISEEDKFRQICYELLCDYLLEDFWQEWSSDIDRKLLGSFKWLNPPPSYLASVSRAFFCDPEDGRIPVENELLQLRIM